MPEKPCVFCQIRDGVLPAAFVYRDDSVLAFLDTRPLFIGHVLVVPFEHHRTLMELPADQLPHLMEMVRRISIATKKALECDGIFNAANNGVSQSVDHLHWHVVPRRKKDGLRGFMWPRLKYEHDDHMAATAAKIASAL